MLSVYMLSREAHTVSVHTYCPEKLMLSVYMLSREAHAVSVHVVQRSSYCQCTCCPEKLILSVYTHVGDVQLH